MGQGGSIERTNPCIVSREAGQGVDGHGDRDGAAGFDALGGRGNQDGNEPDAGRLVHGAAPARFTSADDKAIRRDVDPGGRIRELGEHLLHHHDVVSNHMTDHIAVGLAGNDLLEELVARDHGFAQAEDIGAEAGILVEDEQHVVHDEGVGALAVAAGHRPNHATGDILGQFNDHLDVRDVEFVAAAVDIDVSCGFERSAGGCRVDPVSRGLAAQAGAIQEVGWQHAGMGAVGLLDQSEIVLLDCRLSHGVPDQGRVGRSATRFHSAEDRAGGADTAGSEVRCDLQWIAVYADGIGVGESCEVPGADTCERFAILAEDGRSADEEGSAVDGVGDRHLLSSDKNPLIGEVQIPDRSFRGKQSQGNLLGEYPTVEHDCRLGEAGGCQRAE